MSQLSPERIAWLRAQSRRVAKVVKEHLAKDKERKES